MNFLSITLSLLLSLTSAMPSSYADKPAVKADDLVGVWQPSNKRSKVEIYSKGGKYFGKVIWMIEPNDASGNPRKDVENDDPKLRNRTIMGLEILKGFEYNADDQTWEEGTIYDPKNGSTYSCIIRMENQNQLEVRGYIGFSLIGRSDTWTRIK